MPVSLKDLLFTAGVRTTAGSSSGSGAAAAAGLGFGSIGSDAGGSIRGPAACCGVVGLKPTYGLVGRGGVVPLSWPLDHVGPMTRTVRDCAILLDAIAGHDPVDPTSSRLSPPGYALALDRSPESRPIVGVADPGVEDDATPEVWQAVDAAAGFARDLGWEIRQVTLPHPRPARPPGHCRGLPRGLPAD